MRVAGSRSALSAGRSSLHARGRCPMPSLELTAVEEPWSQSVKGGRDGSLTLSGNSRAYLFTGEQRDIWWEEKGWRPQRLPEAERKGEQRVRRRAGRLRGSSLGMWKCALPLHVRTVS